MTETEYEGLRVLYFEYQALSQKYDSLKLKIALKDTAITMCMQSRDSLIMDNKELVRRMREFSNEMINIEKDMLRMGAKINIWKSAAIISTGFALLLGTIIIVG